MSTPRRGPDTSVRLAISGSFQAVSWANIFWASLTYGVTPSQADLDTWVTSFQSDYKTRFGPITQNGVLYTLAKATLFLSGGGVMQSNIGMTGNGTSGGTAVADNSCSKIVSWQSSVYWRGGKPRSYMPGVNTTDVINGNSLSAASITSLKTAATNFRSDINALTTGAITGTQLGFVSFFNAKTPRVPPVFFAFSGATVHPRLGTQRRRLGRWTT